MKIRTRMAPSPTGEYHIGHIRTVLYNWAFARKNKGGFVIRIEDTDRNRFVEGATERILDVIKRYGLDWDEGPNYDGSFGPYVQSERLDLYKKYAQQLVDQGDAYYCFCTPERLAQMRQEQQDQKVSRVRYDKKCLGLSEEEIERNLGDNKPYVIRLKVPENEDITFNDVVYGEITINSNDLDDQVLLKSDGFPTYHLAVVVDDHLMEISHIMRGNDWLPSTPKHILLYKAFGWDMPTYVHLPNLKELGSNKKLSKRFGSVYAIDFLREGYLPEALVNFLMFLGWNPGDEKEIYSLEEFVADFELEKIHKTDLVAFDREKLLWMNGHYIRNMHDSDLLVALKRWATNFGVSIVLSRNDEYDEQVVGLIKERMKLFSEFSELSQYFFEDPTIDTALLTKFAKSNERAKEILVSFKETFGAFSEGGNEWTSQKLDEVSHVMISEKEFKPKEAFMTLRLAVTGSNATPPIFDVLEVLGKETVAKRLNACLDLL